MKLAISNIAWPFELEERAARLVAASGLTAIEVAPTKVWQKPLDASTNDLVSYRRFWERHGIEIVAMQALLFGRADLTLFETANKRAETADYLKGIVRVGAALGAKALVFGSPKNRKRSGMSPTDVEAVATAFFREIGDYAARFQTKLCLEANPVEYGCDFITSAKESLEFVRRVDSAGFCLHIDSGCLFMAGEDYQNLFELCLDEIAHFHFSAPYLKPINARLDLPMLEVRDALLQHGYKHYMSVEMVESPDALEAVRESIEFLRPPL